MYFSHILATCHRLVMSLDIRFQPHDEMRFMESRRRYKAILTMLGGSVALLLNMFRCVFNMIVEAYNACDPYDLAHLGNRFDPRNIFLGTLVMFTLLGCFGIWLGQVELYSKKGLQCLSLESWSIVISWLGVVMMPMLDPVIIADMTSTDASCSWSSDPQAASGNVALLFGAFVTCIGNAGVIRAHLMLALSLLSCCTFVMCTLLAAVLGTASLQAWAQSSGILIALCASAIVGCYMKELHARSKWLAKNCLDEAHAEVAHHQKVVTDQQAAVKKILSSLCDCLLVVGPNSKILEPCPRLSALLTGSHADVSGRLFSDFLVSEDQARFVEALQDYCQDNADANPRDLDTGILSVKLKYPYGQCFPAHLYYTTFQGELGQHCYLVGLVENRERDSNADAVGDLQNIRSFETHRQNHSHKKVPNHKSSHGFSGILPVHTFRDSAHSDSANIGHMSPLAYRLPAQPSEPDNDSDTRSMDHTGNDSSSSSSFGSAGEMAVARIQSENSQLQQAVMAANIVGDWHGVEHPADSAEWLRQLQIHDTYYKAADGSIGPLGLDDQGRVILEGGLISCTAGRLIRIGKSGGILHYGRQARAAGAQ